MEKPIASPTPPSLIYRTKLALIIVALLMISVDSARAQPESEKTITKGSFLIATEKLDNTDFKHAVVYVTQAGNFGTYGLIINKPTFIPIKEAMPENHKSADPEKSIYFGGPAHLQYLFVLTQNKKHKKLHQITDNIYFGAGRESVIKLNTGDDQIGTRTYIGYSAWAPGQLDEEVQSGAWIIAPTEDKQNNVFSEDPKSVWQKLYKKWSGDWT